MPLPLKIVFGRKIALSIGYQPKIMFALNLCGTRLALPGTPPNAVTNFITWTSAKFLIAK
jgi:hypothetical protein